MEQKAFQDYYKDHSSHCYGCGRLNPYGLQIKSYWDGDETVCRFHAQPYHTAMKGFVYGGLIASVIDCHGTATAAAASYRAQNREMDTDPELRFVTGSLHVDYHLPTPIDRPMDLRATIKKIKGRKVVVKVSLFSGDKLCAKGEVLAIQIPDKLKNIVVSP